ncbi:mannonate dehydratase [Halanaerobium salsuginis]|uniref:mannonate dehydratase n=1 Tax=Halanaerobium salsuginis TaxID=29563 RepID=A0A1I4IQ69_9FIRM|nr:mannonate dehydratase [Halanaerobium salsuginis]SFL56217.1 mannonate dehydratase [Halanaerobium salsuginis]
MTIEITVGQLNKFDRETMIFAKQLGISSVHFNTPQLPGEKYWSLEAIQDLKAECAAYNLKIAAIENIPLKFYDKIMLGLPGKEEQIKYLQKTVFNLGQAGIPILGYHFEPTFVWRTSYAEIRGQARVTAFKQAEAVNGKNIVKGGVKDAEPISEAEMWGNYSYLMENLVPAAEEAGIKLALHPSDPPLASLGGVPRLFRNLASFKRAMEIADSDCWGLDLCLGTFSEMPGGAKNVMAAIEYFVPLQKVFYIHFRDVSGTVPNFKEAFIGAGNYDPAVVIRRLQELKFNGFLLADHVPIMINDSKLSHRARAHAIGYMQGLLQSIK